MVKYKLKKKWLSNLASIFLVSIQKNKIEEKEELVEWEHVEKLDKSKKLVYQTYPDEDFSQNINNDIEEMKKTVSEVYPLQDKKQVKEKLIKPKKKKITNIK